MRRVPLIYADVDIGVPDRDVVAKYMTCELESPDDAVDAYGINVYSWCDEKYPDGSGKDNFEYSPYKTIRDGFQHFDKPVLFTEFGCNAGAFQTHCPYKGGRTWPDVKVIMNQMGEFMSGAIAYEFSMEENQFGVALTPGFLKGQTHVYLLDSYFALQKQFRTHDVSSAWDGSPDDMVNCKWLPDAVAPFTAKHHKSSCPLAEAEGIQERHSVDTVAGWDVLPAAPNASLSLVQGQADCPAYEVPAASRSEGRCHVRHLAAGRRRRRAAKRASDS